MLKFRTNLLKAFWVDLKACLGLVLPCQYCLIVVRENWGWFLGDFISWAMTTPLWSLLYSYYCTVWWGSNINMYLAQIQGYDSHFEDTRELNDVKKMTVRVWNQHADMFHWFFEKSSLEISSFLLWRNNQLYWEVSRKETYRINTEN